MCLGLVACDHAQPHPAACVSRGAPPRLHQLVAQPVRKTRLSRAFTCAGALDFARATHCKRLSYGAVTPSTGMGSHLADVPLVKNLLLLDAEGKRVAVKYYDDSWCAPVLLYALRWVLRALPLTTRAASLFCAPTCTQAQRCCATGV
jgi:hypothetical protein